MPRLTLIILAALAFAPSAHAIYIPPPHPPLTEASYCNPGNWGYFNLGKSTRPLLCRALKQLHFHERTR